jgi:hypothetical protein
MKNELQEQQHIKNAGEIKSRAEKELSKVKSKDAKIKGIWVRIPDFHPLTEIFVRDGYDIVKRVRKFKKDREQIQKNKYR